MRTSTEPRWRGRARHAAALLAALAALTLPSPGLGSGGGEATPQANASTSVGGGTEGIALGGLFSRGEIGGYIALESRSFLDDPSFAEQSDETAASLVLEPEYYREWRNGDQSFTFKPFARLDSVDSERTHFDIRELHWRRSAPRWELLAGVSKVFWGVTESQHLVDIVNQTDLIENPDGEDKLGQPMVKLSLIRNWGIVDLFALPGFRERTFPGSDGRLRAPIPVSDDPVYESGAEENHLDWAVRWSHALGPFDLGVSHFSGTSREPRLAPAVADGEPELIPVYELIDQTGLDAQATLGSWLWKLEAIHRTGQGDPFAATTAGFEYTLWSVFNSNMDVGAVVEHLWDERGEGGASPFQNDMFTGTRLAFNDTQDTQILAGLIADLDDDGQLFLIEASRRVGTSWVVEAEYRGFSGSSPSDPLAALRTDDYFQLSIQRHF
jgi:hypothetical protein